MIKRLSAQHIRTLSSIVCALLLCTCSMNSAQADNQGSAKSACAAPVVLLGAVTGIVVGTPIAIARVSGKSIAGIFHEYDGDPVCWQFWGRPLCLPIGIIEGTVKGCVVGPKNAIKYAKDKPFSKDAFSLEELK